MNNLAEVCAVGLGVGRNYVRCLLILVVSMGLGGAKSCGGGFKVIILRGRGKGDVHCNGNISLKLFMVPLETIELLTF